MRYDAKIETTATTSNVSSPKAPDVATIADDDPVRISFDKQNHYNLLNQGWVQHETIDFDDASSDSEVTKDDKLDDVDSWLLHSYCH